MLGHKHAVIKRATNIMERCVLIHNSAFIEYKESEEKKEALEALEEVVRTIGTALDQYKEKEINLNVLEIIWSSCVSDYYKIIKEYPWLSKFDLHPGEMATGV
ncbi:hypothetical protein [uncultured Clostridium sp.]|uniref:hypothetical protein n=1 Tax=uncultured Clostridium sp. TaxID=59620 RepID=UPI00260854BC|nr:hypothetical protein [uncultured Clostridium sp.]